jgi:hypothetical protein
MPRTHAPSRSFGDCAQQSVIMSYPNDADGDGWINRRQSYELVTVWNG